jgi:hypothetical protein
MYNCRVTPSTTMSGHRYKPFLIFLVFPIILSACLQVTDGSQLPSNGTPTAATTAATIIWFPPTDTSTITPIPATLTPTPEQKPNLGDVIASDDFTRPAMWLLGRFDDGVIALGVNELTLAVSNPGGKLTTFRQEPALTDFYYEVSASPNLCTNGDAYGLVIRAANNTDFYTFLLSCSGQVRVERDRISESITLQDWTYALGPVTPDIGGKTRLGVWVYGREMRFFINGIYQFSVSDPTFPRGLIGLQARSAGSTALTVNFSDLIIREFSGIPVLPATPTPSVSE